MLIFQHTQLAKIAFLYPRGTILLKSAPPSINFLIILLRLRGFRIGLWQEEGIHFKNTDQISPVFSRIASKYIDSYFAWHPADANFATKQGVSPDKIKIVGNIRMELAQQIFDLTETFKQSELTILLITNFDTSSLNYKFKADSNISEETANKENLDAKKYNQIANNNISLYQKLLDHKSSNKYRFMLRPYAFERTNSIFSPRIIQDKNVSIFDTFKEVDLTIHYGSTAGIEGICSGKPSIMLTTDISLVDYRILNSSQIFFSEQDLYDFLDTLIDNTSSLKELIKYQSRLVSTNYEFDFSLSSHSNSITDFVSVDFIKPTRYVPILEFIKEFFIYLKLALKTFIKGFFKDSYNFKAINNQFVIDNDIQTLGNNLNVKVKASRNSKLLKIYLEP